MITNERLPEKDEQEICNLMKAMEPTFNGHPRWIILFALHRSMAAMLAPAEKKSRNEYLKILPSMIDNMLREMDKILQ